MWTLQVNYCSNPYNVSTDQGYQKHILWLCYTAQSHTNNGILEFQVHIKTVTTVSTLAVTE